MLKTLVIFDAGNYKGLEEFGLGDVIMNQLKIKLMIVIPWWSLDNQMILLRVSKESYNVYLVLPHEYIL